MAGRPSCPGLLLFKMCLLQAWYEVSDYEVEGRVNDSLSFMQFVGLQLEDKVPDHSMFSRFRSALTKKDAFERIFEKINARLESIFTYPQMRHDSFFNNTLAYDFHIVQTFMFYN